ncbi:hypothetical protein Bpfe_030960, partial [Biomphalaria pfeifferi]
RLYMLLIWRLVAQSLCTDSSDALILHCHLYCHKVYLVIYISRLNGQLNMRSRKKDEHFKATGGTLNVSLTVKRFYRSTNDRHVFF